MLERFLEITGYAFADAVNPCAIAVLTMVLFNSLIQYPEKRKQVLITGLSFVSAVYLGYMFYSGVLYQLFHSATEFFATYSNNFKFIMGTLGMFIGVLNIKDFFYYSKGGIATEMPIWMRPKVKNVIKDITSPKGAFLVGFIVTLFLLPCTAGPLVLATGALSKLTIMQVIPWLMYYNLIFVAPMLLIVVLVYFGFARVEEVSGWKERNIRLLHLIAGILMFTIGFALIRGWL